MQLSRRRALQLIGSALSAPAVLSSASLKAATPNTVVLLGGPIAVAPSQKHSKGMTSLAARPDGSFAMTWTTTDLMSLASTAWVQLSARSGVPITQPAKVFERSVRSLQPVVVKGGTTLVTGACLVARPGGFRVARQVYTPSFEASGSPMRISSAPLDREYSVVACRLKNGSCFVAWTTEGADLHDAQWRILDATGQPQPLEGHVPGPENAKVPQSVAALQDGGVVLAYTAWHSFEDDYTDVYLQRLTATGKSVGNRIRLSRVAGVRQTKVPGLLGLPDGGFLVMWSVTRADNTNWLYWRNYDSVGRPRATSYARIGGTFSYDAEPTLALASDGKVVAVVSIRTDTPTGTITRLFPLRMSVNGDLLSEPSPIPDTYGPRIGSVVSLGRSVFALSYSDQKGRAFVQRMKAF